MDTSYLEQRIKSLEARVDSLAAEIQERKMKEALYSRLNRLGREIYEHHPNMKGEKYTLRIKGIELSYSPLAIDTHHCQAFGMIDRNNTHHAGNDLLTLLANNSATANL
jgi:hypothetical protein